MAASSERSAWWQDQLGAYRELRARWRDDPVAYAVQRLGLRPTWQQRALLEAIAPEGAKVSCRSGHNTGKTGATSASLLWFLETRDYPKVPCTAPTSAQLRDVLWAEVRKWMRKSAEISARRGDPPPLWLTNLFALTNDRIYDPSAKGEWFAVARTSGRDNPDALQGFHASNVEVAEDGITAVHAEGGGSILFIIEEASGVFEQVYQVAEGALASPGSRLLMVGNPTKSKGYFADSHKGSRGEFTTLHFRTQDSPLADPEYRNKLVRKFGEGSNVVRVRADGEFPKQDDDALISLELAEAAIARPAHQEHVLTEPRIGVDVARFGNDRTTLCLRTNRNVSGMALHAKKDTMETAGIVYRFWLAQRNPLIKVYVDVIGVGAGVADRLRELGVPVVDVNVAESAPYRDNAVDGGVDAQGKTLRDYVWLEMERWLRLDEPSFEGIDKDIAEDLAGELCSVRYSLDSTGRLIIESKDAMKKRGLRSPDLAECLVMTFAPDSSGEVASAGRRTFTR